MSEAYQYLFGPVSSRRLGRSLGVDLIPFKTCTMNCVFCQLGDTPCAVSERSDYAPMQDVLAELERWTAADGQADHITLAGSGEPTLHTRFGDVFRWVKKYTDMASVLLTNGSLLHLPEVRADAALADKVKVTLSAWDEASFQQLHRPAKGVSFDLLVSGERAFREQFQGELSVEIFIVEGINSHVEDVRKIAAIVESIHPDRIDLNTAVRPPADTGVKAVSPEQLAALADILGPKTEGSAAFRKPCGSAVEVTADALCGFLRRHPATAEQLAATFGCGVHELELTLSRLVDERVICCRECDGTCYYFYRTSDQTA